MPKKKTQPDPGTGGVAPGRRRISYVDDKEVHERLSKLASRHGLTLSDMVRHAVRMYLGEARGGEPPLQRFDQED